MTERFFVGGNEIEAIELKDIKGKIVTEKFFVNDEYDNEIDFFETLDEALDYAKNQIQSSNINGWPEEILDGGIKVGKILYQSSKTNVRESTNEGFDYMCDCEMLEIEQELPKNLTPSN